ncbi:unnamed protein product, partial [Echinostoma caproni]|uniref:Adaptin_N domain-containing protein n=1 Tax=Echinostoma caproni TaxID=27848 RepID=A0A183BH45_9TREM
MIMQDSSDALLQAEAINCLQRLHMFAAQHVRPMGLLSELQVCLSSSDLLLRRAAVSYMRQLSQKEADKLYDCSIPEPDSNTAPSVLNSPKKSATDIAVPRI